jgi:hypothetical protein
MMGGLKAELENLAEPLYTDGTYGGVKGHFGSFPSGLSS